jgi:hypothetical protein
LDTSGEGFTPSELNAAHVLAGEGNDVVLRTATGVGRTSDLLVNGEQWDVYTPESGTSVKNILNYAAQKWTQVDGGGVFIDLSNASYSDADFGNALNRVNGFINSWGGTPLNRAGFGGDFLRWKDCLHAEAVSERTT